MGSTYPLHLQSKINNMKKMTNELIYKKFFGFDFKAKVKVDYDGMKDKTYHVYEIVGTRVSIKTDRIIDFNISEVELFPIGYSIKEYGFIKSNLK